MGNFVCDKMHLPLPMVPTHRSRQKTNKLLLLCRVFLFLLFWFACDQQPQQHAKSNAKVPLEHHRPHWATSRVMSNSIKSWVNSICTSTGLSQSPVKMVKEKQTRTYDQDGFRKRAACICVRDSQEHEVHFPHCHIGSTIWPTLQILLVTSSRATDHWIVPGMTWARPFVWCLYILLYCFIHIHRRRGRTKRRPKWCCYSRNGRRGWCARSDQAMSGRLRSARRGDGLCTQKWFDFNVEYFCRIWNENTEHRCLY